MKKNFLICGLDRLGKDTLINQIQQEFGFYQVFHRGRPSALRCYDDSLKDYQANCFAQDMKLIKLADSSDVNIIYNRAWLGESVYAPLYRHYSGDYVFQLEVEHQLQSLQRTRLILLTEDFSISSHFKDDGLSFDPARRSEEQQLFEYAFDKSIIQDKKIICVTDQITGLFKSPQEILQQAIY